MDTQTSLGQIKIHNRKVVINSGVPRLACDIIKAVERAEPTML